VNAVDADADIVGELNHAVGRGRQMVMFVGELVDGFVRGDQETHGFTVFPLYPSLDQPGNDQGEPVLSGRLDWTHPVRARGSVLPVNRRYYLRLIGIDSHRVRDRHAVYCERFFHQVRPVVTAS
jgi:hypothetical protein